MRGAVGEADPSIDGEEARRNSKGSWKCRIYMLIVLVVTAVNPFVKGGDSIHLMW